MFGKKCFKICKGSKLFVSFLNNVRYSSSLATTTRAFALGGAHLFNPSGKGRAMK
jgi:hypothetical protein